MIHPLSALILVATLLGTVSFAATITPTDRGAVAETERYRVEFHDGILVSLQNKLTGEEYLDALADPAAIRPHLPSGLGTQQGEPARAAAETLYRWPWWEHPNDLYLPNQRYPDTESTFAFQGEDLQAVLTYANLTDGRERYPDESFSLTLEIEVETGDLLVTPAGASPRPGVYAANLTLAPLASAVTAEAPITDGVRITRENTGQVLWNVQWPSYWQYGFIAFNGWKRGAVGIWTQDEKLRYYKSLFYLNNDEGLSFSFSSMNVPPFEELTEVRAAVPWRIQSFDTSWAQAVERYHQWRDANLKLAPRPDYTKQFSFIASLPGSQQRWLNDQFLRYVEPWQHRAAAFQTSVRAQQFDRNHADNTPYEGFDKDTQHWREAGTYGMSYLQPMIMWGPFPPVEELSEREQRGIELHHQADTRSVFQRDPDARIPHVDQHHLGHPGWQRWFLDWIQEWCQKYGAQGIYHDQSYPAPIDRRGLAIGGMTSPEGMADYFYKVATENPGTFHGVEMVTEVNAIAADNAIGSGYHWGTAPNMRLARAYDASPVTAALCWPHTVIWSFVRLRGDSTWDLRERRMQEARAQIAGAIDGPYDWTMNPDHWPWMCNTPWHDRTRDVTFLKHGLRPWFPADHSRDVLSYFRGAEGEDFRYEKTPWGSRFVQLAEDGSRRLIYAAATGVQAVHQEGVGIAGWLVYNDDDPGHTWNRSGPSGLHPDRWYVLDPTIERPPVRFSTDNGYGPSFYEAWVADGGYNDYFAFLNLRTIDKLSPVTRWERLVLHSPAAPLAVYVNGKKTEVVPRPEKAGQYTLSVQAPADIVVILKQPPAALADLHQAVLLRATEAEHPVDYYHPERISGQANGGVDGDQRPLLQDVAASKFGLYPARKLIYVPLAAPEGGRGGVYRLHLPVIQQAGRKWNHLIESIAVNGRTIANADAERQAGAAQGTELRIPDVIEVQLQPGEVKLLSLQTLPIRQGPEFARATTRMAVEWIEQE